MITFYSKKAAAFILIILCILSLSPACYASGEDKTTLRVGFTDYSAFLSEQNDGTYTGYAVEYLEKISEYTGYEYGYFSSAWPDLMNKLKNGEIDLVCNAQYTAERAQVYDYSDSPIGSTQGLLFTRTDSDLSYEDFSEFDGLNVGIVSKSAMIPFFEKYEKENGFSCNIIQYDTELEVTQSLKTGETDAMCSDSLADNGDFALVGEFGIDYYYLMSYKNSPYMDDINYALSKIKSDINYESDLYHKYFDKSTARNIVSFTEEEKNFIKNSGTIVVGINADRVPFGKYDEKTGEFSGLNVDILDTISENSGLKFKLKVQKPGVSTADMLSSGEYDVVCGVERDNFIVNDSIIATESFLESKIVPVGLAGRDLSLSDNLTVAVTDSFVALKRYLQNNYPNLKIVGYNYNVNCLDVVAKGEADIFIQNTHLMSQLLQKPEYSGLDILPVDVMTEHTAMAMSSACNPLLVSVLNKSIKNLDPAVISSSLIRYTFASPYKYTLGDMIYRFRVQISIIAVLVFLCFALLLMFVIMKQKNGKKLAEINTVLEKEKINAESANVAKSSFLAQMSHEIRTPMNAIMGFTAIAKNEVDAPEKTSEYLEKIDGSSELLLGIINNILDMSAIENGKLKIDRAVFDLKRLMNNIITVFYYQAKKKDVDLSIYMNTLTEESLIGDELRVKQILMNLLSNAIKFTPSEGKVSLTITQKNMTDNQATLEFIVEDTGCGMSEDMQNRLFMPFEQEKASTARNYGGSGLGLSITKNLVEMMDGTIAAESVLGEGTAFTVSIPFGISSHTEDMAVDKDLRTLVVCKEKSTSDYYGLLLSKLGVRYECVFSQEEALEKLGENEDSDPLNVCLADSSMTSDGEVLLWDTIRKIFGDCNKVFIGLSYDVNKTEVNTENSVVCYTVPEPLFLSSLSEIYRQISSGDYAETKNKSNGASYVFSGRHVLIAEDTALNMEIAVSVLQMSGIEVTCADNGRKAADIFIESDENTFDCIFMDVNMPVMNGYESATAIRNSGKSDAKTVPIYALTANVFSGDNDNAVNSGMDGYIIKPIDTRILYKTLNTIFEQNDKKHEENRYEQI